MWMNQSTGYSWDIMYPRDDLTQTAHQAFERILYVYKTENTSIRRTCTCWEVEFHLYRWCSDMSKVFWQKKMFKITWRRLFFKCKSNEMQRTGAVNWTATTATAAAAAAAAAATDDYCAAPPVRFPTPPTFFSRFFIYSTFFSCCFLLLLVFLCFFLVDVFIGLGRVKWRPHVPDLAVDVFQLKIETFQHWKREQELPISRTGIDRKLRKWTGVVGRRLTERSRFSPPTNDP